MATNKNSPSEAPVSFNGRINSLPAEMLDVLASKVDANDLANFRLTCKRLCAAAAKHFGAKRLAHRRFILTEHSLRGLVDLTAHDVFGYFVKGISLSTRHVPKKLREIMDAIDEQTRANDVAVMGVLRRYDQAARMEDALLRGNPYPEDSLAHELVTQAFTNLKAKGVAATIGIFDESRGHLPPVGAYGKDGSGRGFPFDLHCVTKRRDTLRLLLHAKWTARYEEQTLEVSISDRLSYKEIHARGNLFNALYWTFFVTSPLNGTRRPKARLRIDFLAEQEVLVEAARQLVEVTGHKECAYRPKLSLEASVLLTSHIFPLGIIESNLYHVTIFWNEFTDDILRDQAPVQRVLRIKNCAFQVLESDRPIKVKHFVARLKELRFLRKLELQEIEIEGDGNFDTEVLVRGLVSWHGRKEIRKGLKGLVLEAAAAEGAEEDQKDEDDDSDEDD